MALINTSKEFLNEILSLASKQNMSEKELAKNAGMSPVGLSKAKKRGDLRLSNAIKLLNALELELDLVSRSDSKAEAFELLKQGMLK